MAEIDMLFLTLKITFAGPGREQMIPHADEHIKHRVFRQFGTWAILNDINV
ncbi:hypothetical protein [Saezia sanguinis]|uniref:hypothetical protein n=1 Tax=Saezia sanguinis TaxID=1965230 RepID=UPI0013A6236E|nr:hypothetical protein [Saezia sanguinis]